MSPKVKIMKTKEFKIGRLPSITVKYDDHNRIIYYKDPDGSEEYFEYNDHDKVTRIKTIMCTGEKDDDHYEYNEQGELIGDPYCNIFISGYPNFSINIYKNLDEYKYNENGWDIITSDEDHAIIYKACHYEDCEPYEQWIEVYPDARVIRYRDSDGEDLYYDAFGLSYAI